MTIATLGAFIIGQPLEAVAVMFFYIVGEYFQGKAVKKSKHSIKALLEFRPEYANLIVEGNLTKVSPEEVKISDYIIIKPGEKVPLDGIITEGNSFVDTHALTGESVPQKISAGDTVLAGMINQKGSLKVRVTKKNSESAISKILELVEYAVQKKSSTEKFITTFARYYTPVIILIASLIALIPPLFFSQPLVVWVYRAMVILVISCPCALIISIPLGYFAAIGGASRRGILIKGANYLDSLFKINTVVFDKTGTLTKGEFNVINIQSQDDLTRRELLKIAAAVELRSNHPIAKSILAAFEQEINTTSSEDDLTLNKIEITGFHETEGEGIEAVINNKIVIAGNDKMLHSRNIVHPVCVNNGTVVYLAVDNVYKGYIEISDELKVNSLKTIDELKSIGINNIMLSGDNKEITGKVAKILGIKEYYSELLPSGKVEMMEKIIHHNHKGKTLFIGDGINDAPVLALSDVGVAMGALGSDAAIEAANAVIMNDDPYKVVELIKFSRRTRSIIWQNIIFAISVKMFFVVLGSFGIATMWEAVFGDMGVALLAILNSTRLLKA